MGIIAWIVLGALLGGWLAVKLFHVVTLHGFFNISTWLTAIAGAAILLLARHLVTSRGKTLGTPSAGNAQASLPAERRVRCGARMIHRIRESRESVVISRILLRTPAAAPA
jgi:hypothetical protein